MKKAIFIISILVVFMPPVYTFSQEKPPLKFMNIEEFLRSGVISNKVIVKQIKERGIDFLAQDEDLKSLRDLGADESVITTLQEASVAYERRALGILYIESDPRGAKVNVDEKEYEGRTPLYIRRLDPGRKKLVIFGLDGYGAHEGTVLIVPGETIGVRIELTPLFSLAIKTEPAEATVYLTGDKYINQKVGETGSYSPLVIKDLKGGEYSIEIRKEGYKTRKDTIILRSNRILDYNLEKDVFKLTVKTVPSGANIYLDSYLYPRGTSPASFDLSSGTHTLKITKEDYVIQEDRIELYGDKTLEYILIKEKKFVTVYTDPAGARIFLDDEETSRGQSPTKFEVAPGDHKFTAKKDGFKNGVAEVFIRDKEQRIDIKLETKKPRDILALGIRGLLGTPFQTNEEVEPDYSYWMEKVADKIWWGGDVNLRLKLFSFIWLEFAAQSRFNADFSLYDDYERKKVGTLTLTPYMVGFILGGSRQQSNEEGLYFSAGIVDFKLNKFEAMEHYTAGKGDVFGRVTKMETSAKLGFYCGMGLDIFITNWLSFNLDIKYSSAEWNTKIYIYNYGWEEGYPLKIRHFVFLGGLRFYIF